MTKKKKKPDSAEAIVKALAKKERIGMAYVWGEYGAHTYEVAGLISRARAWVRAEASKTPKGRKS